MFEPGFTCAGNYPTTCGRAEVEPNNNESQANARALDPTPIVFNRSGRVTGAIVPGGDVDVYRVNITTASTVRFEVFDADGSTCTSTQGTWVDVWKSTDPGGWAIRT